MSGISKLFIFNLFVLSSIGLFFVFEASTVESFKLFGHQYHFFRQQAGWLLLSWLLFWVVSRIDLKFLEKYALWLYVGGMLLLIATLIPGLGVKLNGARRWLVLPFGTLQTVEPIKLILLNFFAFLLSKKQSITSFLFFLFWPVLLVMLQPDFGSTMILVGISLIMYFLSGASWKHIALLCAGGFVAAFLVVLFSPYRRERLQTFLSPHENRQDESYHVHQITLALGGGSLFGRGIGNSLQKYSYVPEASSDSIFAIVAEEIGFVGAVCIIFLFTAYFGLATTMLAKRELSVYEQLLCYGILAWIAVQFVFNLAAVVVLLPLSGMPLPFFSQGGSALLMSFMASAVLLSVTKHAKLKKA